MSSSKDTTIYGLISAGILQSADWLSYGEKLLTGAALALISGFTYAAGKWVWEWLVSKRKAP